MINPRELLAQTSLFAGLTDAALDDLAARTSVHAFASGATVVEYGGPPDCLYIVAIGRLRAVGQDGSFIGEIGRLEPTGEIGVLSDSPRNAHVYAVRDSQLLRIGRTDLIEFLLRHPSALLELSRLVIDRLQRNERSAQLDAARRPRGLAVLPASRNVDAASFGALLNEALGYCGRSRLLDAAAIDTSLGRGHAQTPLGGGESEQHVVGMLHELETENRHLVYVADRDFSGWSRRAIRHADRILVVADARDAPADSAMLADLRNSGVRAPVDLILLRADGMAGGDVLGWRRLLQAQTHYFMRPGSSRDAGLIARSLTGRAVGLVLGGGGARGFAHIGAIRALDELQIPIDVIGGSSMGAFLGALLACGYGWREIAQITRDTFINRRLLNDYLFPSVSLIRGRKFTNRLKEIFEDRCVEELRTPYFCVSTNLTRGRAVVHDTGLLHTWVGSSMAVPGVAPPVAYHGELLVDGAVVNALPTDIMQSLQRGPIIASDVSTEGALTATGIEGPDPEGVLSLPHNLDPSGRRPTLFSILFRTATLSSQFDVEKRIAQSDVYLRMPVSGVGLFDWKQLDQLSARAYDYALQALDPLRAEVLSCDP